MPGGVLKEWLARDEAGRGILAQPADPLSDGRPAPPHQPADGRSNPSSARHRKGLLRPPRPAELKAALPMMTSEGRSEL